MKEPKTQSGVARRLFECSALLDISDLLLALGAERNSTHEPTSQTKTMNGTQFVPMNQPSNTASSLWWSIQRRPWEGMTWIRLARSLQVSRPARKPTRTSAIGALIYWVTAVGFASLWRFRALERQLLRAIVVRSLTRYLATRHPRLRHPRRRLSQDKSLSEPSGDVPSMIPERLSRLMADQNSYQASMSNARTHTRRTKRR